MAGKMDNDNLSQEELPDGWTQCRLGDVGKIITGNTPPKSDPSNYGGNIPWVKPPDLNSDEPITKTKEYLSEKGAKLARIIPKNSVMVACIGNLGKIGIAGCELATNQQINSIIFYDFVLPKYGFYYCHTIKNYLHAMASSTVLKIINKSRFSKIPFVLCPLPEQRLIVHRIETLLDKVKKSKENLDKVLKNMKKFREAVLKKAFSGELTKEWREKQENLESATKLLEKIKEEKLKRYEEEVRKAKLQGRRAPKKPDLNIKPIEDESLEKLPEGWIWVRLGGIAEINPKHPPNIADDLPVSFVPMPYLDEKSWKLKKREIRIYKEVKKGYTHFLEEDILFAKITPCMENGKAAIARGLMNGIGCGTTELHIIRPPQDVPSEYIYYFVHREIFRKKAAENMSGTAGQLRVPVSFIKNVSLPLPPLEEQKEIVHRIEMLFKFADEVETKAEKARKELDKLTQAILKKAFNGELTADFREAVKKWKDLSIEERKKYLVALPEEEREEVLHADEFPIEPAEKILERIKEIKSKGKKEKKIVQTKLDEAFRGDL